VPVYAEALQDARIAVFLKDGVTIKKFKKTGTFSAFDSSKYRKE